MHIFVVSRSRWQTSRTLESLGNHVGRVSLVVPTNQVGLYRRGVGGYYGCKVIGCPYDGIALTRKFCGQLSVDSSKFLMLDDDLRFYKRVSATDWRLRDLSDFPDTSRQVGRMLSLVSSKLDKYVHVAISAREGNNRLPYEGAECSRPLRVLAYRRKEFLGVEHGRVEIMEDFDVTMQLLRQGYKNLVIVSWAHNQVQTQMSGGCSDYRSLELHNLNVLRFAELHTPFVSLREKHNKRGRELSNRVETTIYWKRAWESSQLETNKKGPRMVQGP